MNFEASTFSRKIDICLTICMSKQFSTVSGATGEWRGVDVGSLLRWVREHVEGEEKKKQWVVNSALEKYGALCI